MGVALLFSRRTLLQSAALIAGGFALGYRAHNLTIASQMITVPDGLRMPDEGETHLRTWMAYVAHNYVWSRKQIPEVKRNLMTIARTIAKYEPVTMLVSPEDFMEAEAALGNPSQYPHPIELVVCPIDDLWLRDTGPTFVFDAQGAKQAIDFNFNGWGRKQEYRYDAMVAEFITGKSRAGAIATDLVLEGGSIEIDGYGNAILTKSSVLNRNRNPDWTQAEVEAELKELLGLRHIIWLDGIKGRDITDAHVDFYARFVGKGQVVASRDNYGQSHDYDVTRANIATLNGATDADGNPLEVTIIDAPNIINESFGARDFAAGYIGYYLCNGAVIMQKFGDPEMDQNAKEILAELFPDRVIEQLAIDGIASGGGSIHCATQQEPA